MESKMAIVMWLSCFMALMALTGDKFQLIKKKKRKEKKRKEVKKDQELVSMTIMWHSTKHPTDTPIL